MSKRPTPRLGIRKRVEVLFPPTVLRVALKPGRARKRTEYDLRVLIRVQSLLRDLHALLALRHRLLRPEVLHVKKPSTVQDELLLPIPPECNLQRLERHVHLNTVLGTVRGAYAILPDAPLDLLTDLRLLEQCPRRSFVIPLPQAIHLVHSYPHDTVVVYPHIEAELDLRING